MKIVFLFITNIVFLLAILLLISLATPVGDYVTSLFGYKDEESFVQIIVAVAIVSGVITKLGENE